MYSQRWVRVIGFDGFGVTGRTGLGIGAFFGAFFSDGGGAIVSMISDGENFFNFLLMFLEKYLLIDNFAEAR